MVDGEINSDYRASSFDKLYIRRKKWDTAGFVRAHQRKYWNALTVGRGHADDGCSCNHRAVPPSVYTQTYPYYFSFTKKTQLVRCCSPNNGYRGNHAMRSLPWLHCVQVMVPDIYHDKFIIDIAWRMVSTCCADTDIFSKETSEARGKHNVQKLYLRSIFFLFITCYFYYEILTLWLWFCQLIAAGDIPCTRDFFTDTEGTDM